MNTLRHLSRYVSDVVFVVILLSCLAYMASKVDSGSVAFKRMLGCMAIMIVCAIIGFVFKHRRT